MRRAWLMIQIAFFVAASWVLLPLRRLCRYRESTFTDAWERPGD